LSGAADARLATARLELVPVTTADAAALQSLYGHPDLRRFQWDDVAVDDVETVSVIRQSLRSFRAHGYGLWRVLPRGESTLAGVCGLREVGTEAELVVLVEPSCQRRGYAREAAGAVLGHALRRLRLPRVIALCDTGNGPAQALVRALGMREQHVTRASGFGRTLDVVLHEIVLADLPPPAPRVARSEA
jgi:RimJ/RimL family protein N-acetyltransferase